MQWTKSEEELVAKPHGTRWSVVRKGIAVASWLYLLALIALCLLLRLTGDRWWLGTVLIFAPRWIWGLPLLALVPAAVCLRRRLVVCTICVAVWLGPVMGLCVPWQKIGQALPRGAVMRVLTYNMGGSGADAARVASLLSEQEPDVVAFQECPPGMIRALAKSGLIAKSYPFVTQRHHLGVMSRFPLADVRVIDRRPFGGWGNSALMCTVTLPGEEVPFVNVHLTTPRPGLEAALGFDDQVAGHLDQLTRRRAQESECVSRWIAQHCPRAVVAGDFNMPVESGIYQDYWSSFRNAFSQTGWGFGYTKHTRWHGVRIDHVLCTRTAVFHRSFVLPRLGGDHSPLIAELGFISDQDR